MSTQQITDERLAGWKKKLAADNATPFALIGIGHGEKAGTVVLCIPENGPSEREIGAMLIEVGKKLRKGGGNERN